MKTKCDNKQKQIQINMTNNSKTHNIVKHKPPPKNIKKTETINLNKII